MTARQAILAAMPGTTAQLREQTGYAASYIRRELIVLRSNDLVHVSAWRRTVGSFAAVYSAGQGRDAPKIEPKTKTERCRQYRAHAGNPVRVPDRMLSAALMAQSRAFPLAGVWA